MFEKAHNSYSSALVHLFNPISESLIDVRNSSVSSVNALNEMSKMNIELANTTERMNSVKEKIERMKTSIETIQKIKTSINECLTKQANAIEEKAAAIFQEGDNKSDNDEEWE